TRRTTSIIGTGIQPQFHPLNPIHPSTLLFQQVPFPRIPVFRLKNTSICLIRLLYINAVYTIPPIATYTKIYNKVIQPVKIKINFFRNLASECTAVVFSNKTNRITGYHFEGICRTVGSILLGITTRAVAKNRQNGQYINYKVGTFFHHLYYFS